MPTDFDICNEVLATIRKIIRSIDIHSKKLKQLAGVTGPQLVILKQIHNQEQITTSELAAKVSLSQSTVTNILERMEEKNWISRKRDVNDKRKWFLTLTETGKDILTHAPSSLQVEFVANFCSLPKWEQTQMLATLQRVAAMMTKEKY